MTRSAGDVAEGSERFAHTLTADPEADEATEQALAAARAQLRSRAAALRAVAAQVDH
jgi:hypothetical protein